MGGMFVGVALAVTLASWTDPRLISTTDAKTAPLTLSLAKRCKIKATTQPLPINPAALIKVQWLAVLADKPIADSDPRLACYKRLIRASMPTAVSADPVQ